MPPNIVMHDGPLQTRPQHSRFVAKPIPHAADEDSPLHGSHHDLIANLKSQLIAARLEVSALEKERDRAKESVELWRGALRQDDRPGSQYRYRINELKRDAEESKEGVVERDQAIEKLVGLSLEQETRHQKELQKLRDENQEFKAKVTQKQEEIEVWKRAVKSHRNEQISSQQQTSELERVKAKLKQSEGQCFQYRKETISLRKELLNLQAQQHEESQEVVLVSRKPGVDSELEELRNENESMRQEVRELRRQLWDAKDASGESEDTLREELELTRERLVQQFNEGPRVELRDLRRELWSAKAAAGEAQDLKAQLEQAKQTLCAYAQRLDKIDDPKKLEPLRVLLDKTRQKNSALETEKVEHLEKIKQQGEDIQLKGDQIAELERKTKNLERKLEDAMLVRSTKARNATSLSEGDSFEKMRAERDKLVRENESMRAETITLRLKLETSLADCAEGEDAVENGLVKSYKRQIWELTKERDELTQLVKENNGSREVANDSEELDKIILQNQQLKVENKAIHQNFDSTIKRKSEHIDALEQALCAQEQIIDSMKAEFENAHQGFIAAGELKAKQQAAEITRLKLELEESIAGHATEVSQLKGSVENTEKLKQQISDLQRKGKEFEIEILSLNTKLKEREAEYSTDTSRMNEIIENLGKDLENATDGKEDSKLSDLQERLESMTTRNLALRKKNELLIRKAVISNGSVNGLTPEVSQILLEPETEGGAAKNELDTVMTMQSNFDDESDESRGAEKPVSESSQMQASKRLRKFASFFLKKRGQSKAPPPMEFLEEVDEIDMLR